MLTYPHLPEAVCAGLRAVHDGFGMVQEDLANNRLLVKTENGVVPVEYDDAHDYIDTWRMSGLWALRGEAR